MFGSIGNGPKQLKTNVREHWQWSNKFRINYSGLFVIVLIFNGCKLDHFDIELGISILKAIQTKKSSLDSLIIVLNSSTHILFLSIYETNSILGLATFGLDSFVLRVPKELIIQGDGSYGQGLAGTLAICFKHWLAPNQCCRWILIFKHDNCICNMKLVLKLYYYF